MRTVAVVGTVVDDRITGRDGTTRGSLGGIAYSVGALSALAGSEVRILPVCRVGTDLLARLTRHWSGLEGVELDGLVAHDGPNTRIELDYRHGASGGDRRERLASPMPPLQERDLAVARSADSVLVNCITGFDLRLEALEELAECTAPIHLDFHSLALGMLGDGTRVPRSPQRAARWIATADLLQCNKFEMARIAGTDCLVAKTISTILDGGPQAVVVTASARGSILHLADQPESVTIIAPPVNVLDPTGAGDTFGAAMVVARLRGEGWAAAARYASLAASASCLLAGCEGLARLPEAMSAVGSG